jgi:hypothetical protein
MVESLDENLEDEMTEAVIIDAMRTPVGALGGVLASVRPDDLATLVIKEIVQRNKLDPALIEEVYFGCAMCLGKGIQELLPWKDIIRPWDLQQACVKVIGVQ